MIVLFRERRCHMDDISSLVEKYGDMLYRISYLRLHNAFDAEDAVQETFLRYIKNRPDIEDPEHLKAWLFRVAINVCRDAARKKKIRIYIPLDSIGEIAGDEPEDTEIIQSLSLLPEKYGNVLFLYYVEGYDVKSIGKIVGCGESAVKMRLARGRDRLREMLKGESDE